jgi:hypothetical protein
VIEIEKLLINEPPSSASKILTKAMNHPLAKMACGFVLVALLVTVVIMTTDPFGKDVDKTITPANQSTGTSQEQVDPVAEKIRSLKTSSPEQGKDK